MTTNALVETDETQLLSTLQEATAQLDTSRGEVTLDFSGVTRIQPAALKAMEALAEAADGRSQKVTLNGVNVEIYKVLKLMKLAERFSFQS